MRVEGEGERYRKLERCRKIEEKLFIVVFIFVTVSIVNDL